MHRTSKKTTRIERTTQLELDRGDVLEALVAFGMLTREEATGATLTVRVPGGGDWSNAILGIGADSPLWISWHTVDIEEVG